MAALSDFEANIKETENGTMSETEFGGGFSEIADQKKELLFSVVILVLVSHLFVVLEIISFF